MELEEVLGRAVLQISNVFFSYGVLSSLARVDEPVRKAVGVFLR